MGVNRGFLSWGALAFGLLVSASAGAATTTIPQSALVPSTGYYTNDLGPNIVTTGGGNANGVGVLSGRNDDGYMFLALPFNVGFFGTTYNSLYINNNGNVSFGAGISAYVPTGPTGANQPVISPFFGDVDTRTSSGVVHYQLSVPDQLVVTWDNVGFYDSHSSPTNSFQLVLRGEDYVVPAGEGPIGFFYGNMGWEVTNTSTVAAAGFGDGAGNAVVIEGSTQPGLNAALQNHHTWFNTDLTPVPPVAVPGPLAGAGLIPLFGLAGAWYARRRKRVVA